MRWIADCSDSNIDGFTDFLRYHGVPYDPIDTWQCRPRADRCHDVPDCLAQVSDCAFVTHPMAFEDMLQWPNARQDLLDFLRNNHVVVWGNIDSFLIIDRCRRTLAELDQHEHSSNCHVFVDARPTDHHWSRTLHRVQIHTWPLNWFCRLVRPRGVQLDKNPDSYDFLLTMVLKSDRPWRRVLWRALKSQPNVMTNALVHCHDNHSNWIGQEEQLRGQTSDHCRYPSMDLYRNAWFEIVPETLTRHAYYFTEKIIKPITTKTPFVVVANQHYLKFLHQHGFKTFGNLIDETYDDHWRVEDRVQRMLDQVAWIIDHGPRDFYHAAGSILDHNYQRLAEISGDWENRKDRMLWSVVSQVDQKFNSLYNMDIIEEQT